LPVSRGLTGAVSAHTVQPGETLTSIGARYGVDWRTLARDNELDSPDALRAGHILRIDNRHVVPDVLLHSGWRLRFMTT
jgi:L,D-transpeptidase ErfK/SrfK